MKAKCVILTVLLMGVILLQAGCWNSRELKDLAIVMAMGIDKAPKTNQYRVSFQIVNPGTVASGASGGGSGAGSGGPIPVTIYTGTGDSLYGAIRKASQKVPRQLFFGHLQLLIIGEALAKEGIHDLFDFFDRSYEARLTTVVLVSRGSEAETIVKILTPLEKIPANAIYGKIQKTSKLWSENIRVEIDDVVKALASEGEAMISGVRIAGDPEDGNKKSNIEQTALPAEVNIKGIALFKDGKLKRWLDGHEARGTLWIRNKMKSTIIDLDCKDKKGAIGVEIIRSHTKVNAEVLAGKPVIHIHIKEEGNVNEVKCSKDLSKAEEITKLEEEWVKETKKEVLQAVKAVQKEKSDIFGFGEAVNRANPKAWKEMKKDWSQTFSEIKIEVKVDAFIRHTGMRLKPFISELEKKGKK